MGVGADDAMGLLRRAGDVTGKLRRGDARGQRGEELGLQIAVLDLEPVPVDGRAVEPGRGAGLEAPERKARRVEAARERDRGRIAEAPGRRALFAEMDDPAEERAGGENDGRAGDRAPVGELDSGDGAVLRGDPRRFALDHGQVRRSSDERLHGAAVELAVRLGARALDSGALAAVEDAELDAGGVRGARHDAVERVDLAHQMALAQAADRGIARHFADRGEPMGDERGRGA